MPHVTIIGGGIAGLATAYYLQEKSRARGDALDYTLVEGSSRFGGKIITAETDGFIIEGGPDSFITPKPWAMQLCCDLGITDRLIPTNDDRRNIFVLQKGRLVPFPGGYRLTVPTEFIPFVLSPLISPWGKLRMGLDLFLPARREKSDESLADFIRRRLGAEALDKIGGPIMAGIYSADPERLSLQSTFPQFAEMERKYGSLIKAMRLAKKQRRPAPSSNGKAPSMFTSLRGGMEDLVAALVDQLDGDLQLNCRVTGLKHLSPGFEVTVDHPDRPPLTTDAVVVAVPAYVATNLVEPIKSELAELLRQIRYASTANISLGYRRADLPPPHTLDGFGFMVPRSENRKITACTWTSTKLDHRAPDDGVLLRNFVGGDYQENLANLPDDELIALARAELAEIMGITAEPLIHRVFRWPQASPQYDVGHLDRVTAMEALAAELPGLYLAGSAFRGIGIPDCIKSALTAVDQILAQFG